MALAGDLLRPLQAENPRQYGDQLRPLQAEGPRQYEWLTINSDFCRQRILGSMALTNDQFRLLQAEDPRQYGIDQRSVQTAGGRGS